MTNSLYRLGHYAARRPARVIALWVVAAVLIVGASNSFGRELEDSFGAPGLDSQQAIDLLTETAPDQAGVTAQVVLTPLDDEADFFTSPDAVAAIGEVRQQIDALPNVVGTVDPAALLAQGPEAAIAAGAVSPDGKVAVLRVQYPALEALSVEDYHAFVDGVADAGADSPLQVEYGGELSFQFAEAEAGNEELVGILAAVVILLLAFGSVIAMGLPIGMALFGLAIGVSSMTLVTYLVDIPSWTPQLASMIGLGVGIDYALFLVTRHREHLAQGLSVAESAGLAVATAGQAVIFAGGTVVIAILGLAVAGIPFVTAAGVATSIIVAIMVACSITLIPAFLGLAGTWINRLGFGRATKGADGGAGLSPGWQRWGRHVASHPWVYAIGVTTLLLALTAPVLALQLGNPDQGSLPDTRSERRAYDLVADGFGPGVNGPLLIAVDLNGDAWVVEPLAAAIAADDGIAAVAPPTVDTEADVATLVAFATTSPQDDATVDTIQRLRADVFPTVLDDPAADSAATAHIGGSTALLADVAERITQRLPWFMAAVILLSFVLLTLVFRSILVPLKAAVLNLLSIGAAFGVLVMVFQWGWGKELIGLEGTVPIISFIPLFMFAILFGLSMDYEVFLLSRVREEYLVSGDNDASVIHGIAGTARVITSAALIMISVFAGFVLGDDPTTKMFGLGLATAIFVDATIVRIVLVPATMKLMGDANWWIPGWLDRLLPTVDIEGAGAIEALAASHTSSVDPTSPPAGDRQSDDREPVRVG
jgi:RND superfamily putative drug exporter